MCVHTFWNINAHKIVEFVCFVNVMVIHILSSSMHISEMKRRKKKEKEKKT